MKKFLIATVAMMVLVLNANAQLQSADYRAPDNGSLTHGGIVASASTQSAIINTWWEGHVYGSVDYEGFSNVPGGFVFPCIYVQQPVIMISGDTLTCTPAASYQWFFNGNIINGATDQVFIASQSGNYTVEIIDSIGCTASSEQVMLAVGVDEPEVGLDNVKVYPNPVSDVLKVEWESAFDGEVAIQLVSLVGEIAFSEVVDVARGSGSHPIAVSHLSSGVYVLYVSTQTGQVARKIVKG